MLRRNFPHRKKARRESAAERLKKLAATARRILELQQLEAKLKEVAA